MADNKPYAVVSYYSFDNPQVKMFDTFKECVEYVHATAEEEYRIDTEENGWNSELRYIDEGYARIHTYFSDHTDVTEFIIAEVED